MRYRLRTLLIVLALGPPVLAVGWWEYSARRAEQGREEAIEAERARRKALDNLIELTTSQKRVQVLSEPPATPMQLAEVDVRKLTRPQ
jgi:hypothetical protein